MYIYQRFALLSLGGLLTLLPACQKSAEDFEPMAFNANSSQLDNLLLKGDAEAEGTLQTQLAQPVQKACRVIYFVTPSLLEHYRAVYKPTEPVEVLGTEYFDLPSAESLIPQGGVKGSEVKVLFKNLNALDRDKVYILPLRASSPDIALLESQATHFFVLKGAALINVVAGGKENYFTFHNTTSHSELNGLTQMTIEALVRVDKFGRLISTIMGREGNFLLRVGDAGVPDNQLQLATSNGNITDPAWTLQPGRWTHIAMTIDATASRVSLYLDGVKKGRDYRCPVSLINWDNMGDRGFYIGYSYNGERYLDGDFAECRIWKRVLSAEEIQSKDHFYSVDPASEGLVAYWKFNEGQGAIIKDATANRYDLRAHTAVKWTEVELPAKH